MQDIMYVNIYSVGRAYGGPEEGGWWFDTGVPIGAIPVFITDDERMEIYDELWEALHPIAEKRFTARVDGEVPVNWMEEFPDEFEKRITAAIREHAQPILEKYREVYANTGKRNSVLGGEDYDVVLEEKFPRPFPLETPRFE